jgi:quinol monooxygenase YgiN
MDDLIDSMARRHLASRRLDVCIRYQTFRKEKKQTLFLIFRELWIVNDVIMEVMVLISVEENILK